VEGASQGEIDAVKMTSAAILPKKKAIEIRKIRSPRKARARRHFTRN